VTVADQSLGWRIPERIGRLEELAHNLWWSWHVDGGELFRNVNYVLWRIGGHNPVKQLRETSPERLQQLASDSQFLALYDSVMAKFDAEVSAEKTWFGANYPDLLKGPVAYFSMELAIHSSLPIYAGGLGILAGDMCKEASDIGLPFVAVGFMYPQGYFRQHITAAGTQEEHYHQLDFDEAPIRPMLAGDGRRILVKVPLGKRSVSLAVWRVKVGRVDVYLLDTNVSENAPQERQLSARLYVADPEIRLQQEIVLGMGGVRVLRALGIQPAIWHSNEGHTAFMTLERLREEVEEGRSFEEAARRVRSSTIFTTHTPVPAGQDVFPAELVERYLSDYCSSLEVSRKECLRLGQLEGSDGRLFNMAALALRMSEQRYGVSRIHGAVARKMWHVLWPEVEEDSVPIAYITNGIHTPSWVAFEMRELYDKYLGADWLERHDDPSLWEGVAKIPDRELWDARRVLRHELVNGVLELAQKAWATNDVEPHQLVGIGALLHPEVLTVGFVRRFADYKRPTLIFRDLERLKRIVRDPFRPVQIVFAGKSHPADFASKELVSRVFSLAMDRDFMGRIAFLEDYDMHMARYLAHGVDVWLNTPRRLNEACGTSGMKAVLNGVLHLSVRDGWWDEGYNGANGWAIGDVVKPPANEEEDRTDAESIYRILERDVVPLFYMRDREGVPHGWMRMVKESIRTLSPRFCTRRMMKEYIECSLGPACKAKID
jgi:starch phosphorylase